MASCYIMSLSYNVAEYFVEAISKSPEFCITYDTLKNHMKQANQDLDAYLNVESKYNFIFNRFPEIFIYNNGLICFTDAFLSLYKHKKASKLSPSWDCSLDLENSVIFYFLQILNLYGPQHYLSLFNMLVNDKTQKCVVYFNYYTFSEVFHFFASNSNYFVLNNDIVATAPSCPDKLYKKEKKAKRTLSKYVCFLLKCFKILHYFELRECIIYADSNCQKFLEQFSLIKHREFFENLPNIVIDKYGFLSLKDNTVNTSFSKKQKMKLLIVCILAYKKEVHFESLINEAIEKSKLFVVYFQNMSTKDKIKFLNQNSSKLIMSENGFVRLLPTFFLPKCSFEGLSSTIENIMQTACTKALQNTVSSNYKEIKEIKIRSPNPVSVTSQDQITAIQEHIKQSRSVYSTIINKYLLCIPALPHTVNEQIKFSVFYLLKYFYSLDYRCILKTLLHVLDDFRKTFLSLSKSKKQDVILVFCNFIKTIAPSHLDCITEIFEISDEEKILLIISLMLIHKKTLYFEKIISVLMSKNILNSLCSSIKSDPFKFFEPFDAYMSIENDGYIILAQTFNPIESVIDSYSSLFFKNELISKCYPFFKYSKETKFAAEKTEKSINVSMSRYESGKSGNISQSLSVSLSKSRPQKEEKQQMENVSKNQNVTEDPHIEESRNSSRSFLNKSKSKSISDFSSEKISFSYISKSPSDKNSSESVSSISFGNSNSDVSIDSFESAQSESNASFVVEIIQNSSTSNCDFYQVEEVNVISETANKSLPELCSIAESSCIKEISDNKNSCFLKDEMKNAKLESENKLAIEKKSDEGTSVMRNPVNVSLDKTDINKNEVGDKPTYIAPGKLANLEPVSGSEGINKINMPLQPYHLTSSCQQKSNEVSSLTLSKENKYTNETASSSNTLQSMPLSDSCRPVHLKATNKYTLEKSNRNFSDVLSSGVTSSQHSFENTQMQEQTVNALSLKPLSKDENSLDISLDPNYEFKSDTPHRACVSELIDSHLTSMPFESSKASETFITKSVTEDIDETYNKFPDHLPQNAAECSKTSNCISTDAENSNFPENSNTSSTSNCDSGVTFLLNDRAVNFFCVILGNYRRYYSGFSANFLKQQLRRASSEVQSYMHENYKDDLLSFFQNYKELFYVSLQSHLVYMLKNIQ